MTNQLKIGLMGAGNIAGMMAKTVNGMEDVSLYAIASRTEEKAKSFADKYGVEKAYGSYEAMLQDENVDLVYIATPHSEHFENAMLCIKHKKPVLCEKAFTVNAKQAKEVLDEVHAHGRHDKRSVGAGTDRKTQNAFRKFKLFPGACAAVV